VAERDDVRARPEAAVARAEAGARGDAELQGPELGEGHGAAGPERAERGRLDERERAGEGRPWRACARVVVGADVDVQREVREVRGAREAGERVEAVGERGDVGRGLWGELEAREVRGVREGAEERGGLAEGRWRLRAVEDAEGADGARGLGGLGLGDEGRDARCGPTEVGEEGERVRGKLGEDRGGGQGECGERRGCGEELCEERGVPALGRVHDQAGQAGEHAAVELGEERVDAGAELDGLQGVGEIGDEAVEGVPGDDVGHGEVGDLACRLLCPAWGDVDAVKRQAPERGRREERTAEVDGQGQLVEHDGIELGEVRYHLGERVRRLEVSRRPWAAAGVFEMDMPDMPVGIGSLREATGSICGRERATVGDGGGGEDVGEQEGPERARGARERVDVVWYEVVDGVEPELGWQLAWGVRWGRRRSMGRGRRGADKARSILAGRRGRRMTAPPSRL
jgi:hypothetical protein